MELLRQIAQFIDSNSYFDVDEPEEGDDIVSSRTRDNGNVGDEEVGDQDVSEAVRLRKAIIEKFVDVLVHIEFVDEWVHLDVKSSKLGEYDLNDLPEGVSVQGHGIPSWMDNRIEKKEPRGILLCYKTKGGNLIDAYDINKIEE